MILLPDPPRRHWVSAFWLSFSALAAGAMALLSGVINLPGGALGAVPVGVVLGVAGTAIPDLATGTYRVWNRLARRVSSVVAGYVTRLLFFVVSVAGPAGSRFEMGGHGAGPSSWTPKGTVKPEHYRSQYPGDGGNRGSWSGLLLGWSQRTGRLWMLPMVPLIALLGLVQTSEKGSFGGNVYTLY